MHADGKSVQHSRAACSEFISRLCGSACTLVTMLIIRPLLVYRQIPVIVCDAHGTHTTQDTASMEVKQALLLGVTWYKLARDTPEGSCLSHKRRMLVQLLLAGVLAPQHR